MLTSSLEQFPMKCLMNIVCKIFNNGTELFIQHHEFANCKLTGSLNRWREKETETYMTWIKQVESILESQRTRAWLYN